jgi:nitronate monooxygenase
MKSSLVTELAGFRYPLIQAPMLGITTPEMVAAVSNAGGLGSLPVGGLAPDKARELIQKTKSLTDAPFAVNLFAHTLPQVSHLDVETMREFLLRYCAEQELDCEIPAPETFRFYTCSDQLEVLLEAELRLISFTFGIPDEAMIATLKSRGCMLIGTATCVEEARILEQKGIDAVCAQGIEAGGHRGTFVEDLPLPQIGTMALVPQLIDAVTMPVIAAGGISDGRGINAAFGLGAAAVQIGTAFIGCNESLAIPSYKARLQTAGDTDSGLTTAFSGRWARGLRNAFMQALDEAGIAIPAYPIQNTLTSLLRAAAQQQDRHELTNLWSGQYARKTKGQSTGEVFEELLREAELRVE